MIIYLRNLNWIRTKITLLKLAHSHQILIMFGLHSLMYDVISNYEDNKYITRLKESNEI